MTLKMNRKIMLTRMATLAGACTLLACGASMDVPYSIATSPTVWINYPTECPTTELPDGGGNVCSDDAPVCASVDTNEFAVHFVTFNQPANTVVRVRLDRHLNNGVVIAQTNTSPVLVSLQGRNPNGEHLVDVEIVNADGTPLTAAQTKNNSHKFQVYFKAAVRDVVVAGTEAEALSLCPEVVECADDDECDEGQACSEGVCATPEE